MKRNPIDVPSFIAWISNGHSKTCTLKCYQLNPIWKGARHSDRWHHSSELHTVNVNTSECNTLHRNAVYWSQRRTTELKDNTLQWQEVQEDRTMILVDDGSGSLQYQFADLCWQRCYTVIASGSLKIWSSPVLQRWSFWRDLNNLLLANSFIL